MKSRWMTILIALAVVSTGTLVALSRQQGSGPHRAAVASRTSEEIVAAPGRVEAISEEVKVSAEIGGRLAKVEVEEGDRIQPGQVLAQLENADYVARVASAEAQLRQREAELRRVVNGARSQERREALADLKAAEAVLENARIEMNRRTTGYRQGVFAKEEADRAEREFGVAKGRYDAAKERYELIEDDAREEDRSRAEAAVALARAQLDEARAWLAKTYIRSPLNGTVLRKHKREGESVSTQFDSPIVTLADDSTRRVRVDVDETDVGKIAVGQRAYVTADAFPGQKFSGKVVRVGRLLGKKNVRTDEPTERVDTKILETLVELDSGRELPLGLRVDAFIQVSSPR